MQFFSFKRSRAFLINFNAALLIFERTRFKLSFPIGFFSIVRILLFNFANVRCKKRARLQDAFDIPARIIF